MIIYTKPTYKCEHCRKLYQRMPACEKHERACVKNPDNDRPCFGCVHSEIKDEVRYEFSEDYDRTIKFHAVFCNKIQSYLIPPKSEHKGNAYESDDLGDGTLPNVVMPRKCDKRKTETINDIANLVNPFIL